jgi:hypothetical protein
MNASEFLSKHGVTVTWKYRETTVTDGWEHKRWTVYVTNDMGRTESFPYRTGMAHTVPVATDVLWALAGDCRIFEDNRNPHDVMSEFGMDDYRKAEKLYDTCNETVTTLSDLFNGYYAEFLTIEDE